MTSPATPRIVVNASAAFEFLMSLATLSDPSAWESFEVGPGWLAATERRAGSNLMARVRNYSGNERHLWLNLLGLAARLPIPRSVDALIGELRAMDPLELCRHLTGYFGTHVARGPHAPLQSSIGADRLGRAIEGDAEAVAQVVKFAPLPFPAAILSEERHETKQRLLDIVQAWAADVWPMDAALVMPVLERDAVEKELLLGHLSFDRFVEVATRGIRWPSPPPGVEVVLMAPTYVNRPWVSHAAIPGTLIIVYPVADAHLGLDKDVPTRRLARLSAAHHARYRLDILRALAGHERTLEELGNLVGATVDVLLADLVALRTAGLIMANAETRTYSLHSESVPDLGQLLGVVFDLLDGDHGRPTDEVIRLS